jgi:hypothetical protein
MDGFLMPMFRITAMKPFASAVVTFFQRQEIDLGGLLRIVWHIYLFLLQKG